MSVDNQRNPRNAAWAAPRRGDPSTSFVACVPLDDEGFRRSDGGCSNEISGTVDGQRESMFWEAGGLDLSRRQRPRTMPDSDAVERPCPCEMTGRGIWGAKPDNRSEGSRVSRMGFVYRHTFSGAANSHDIEPETVQMASGLVLGWRWEATGSWVALVVVGRSRTPEMVEVPADAVRPVRKRLGLRNVRPPGYTESHRAILIQEV